MIVITNPIAVKDEIRIIHSLFAEELSLLHIRKPHFSEIEMKAFVSEIGLDFREQLVLHSHHNLASAFGINRLHFSEKDRIHSFLSDKSIKSTSTHSIEEFNALGEKFDYAFLSPVYPSISKPDYFSKINHLETIKKRTNFSTKLIALGGISSENILTTLENGFDDVALLGTIWNSKNPLIKFKKCQQIVLSYSQ